MRVFYRLIAVVILGMAFGNYVHTENKVEPININIDTNYPIENRNISLPNDSTELNIHVDSQNAKTIRFYSMTPESDSKELLKEDANPTDGSDFKLNYKSTDGFSNKIIVEAIYDDGTTTKKSFGVDKGIDMEPTDTNEDGA